SRNQDATGRRLRRRADVPPDCIVCGGVGRSESAAYGDGLSGRQVFLWRVCGEHGGLASVLVGCQLKDEFARKAVDACSGLAHSASSWLDGVRQAPTLTYRHSHGTKAFLQGLKPDLFWP